MSDSDEDNFIRYGTPLDPYEEDEVPSKKKRDPTEQHALDAHGRRRFHGAFTGGFSAGFGNSVGTPEGWVPTAFKSSRSEKAMFTSQRPEDFMDEEDRGEFGIAPVQIHTKSEFSGQKRPLQQKRFHDGPIPGEPVLEQLLRPVHETTAVKMLQAMGWKPGQGAGERLTVRDKRTARDKHRVYGCYLPPELRQAEVSNPEEDSDSDSEFDYENLFAPDDYEPYILQRKDDRFGLGYSGLSRHSVLGNLVGEYGTEPSSSSSHLLMKEKGKKISIHGQAFGVGALEDADEDIYAREDMSHYDFSIGGPTPTADKPKDKQKNSNILEGFVKASKAVPAAASHPPPALPRDYVPAAAGQRRTRFQPDLHHAQRDQGLGRHDLSSEARSALLGETPIERPKPSDTPSEKGDPISKAFGRNVNFVTDNEPQHADVKDQNSTPDFIPMEKGKNDNINIFKPFVSDPMKQARYERFLEDKDKIAAIEKESMDRVSEWERNRELAEFEQAAKLYKPLTGIMGDRFTHASEPDAGAINPLVAVAKSTSNRGAATRDQIEAAEKGLFGALTRTEAPWRPEFLVCKRFNVPDPFVSKPEQKKEEKSKTSYSIFEYLETSVHNKESFTKEQTQFSGSKSLLRDVLPKPKYDKQEIVKENNIISKHVQQESSKDTASEKPQITNTGVNKRMTVAELFLHESEKDQHGKEVGDSSEVKDDNNVIETIDKFDKMELYKAIFLSDSEEEEDDKIIRTDASEPKSYSDFVDVPKNVERNPSPPRGIFANVDFDELNSWNRSVATNEEKDDKTVPDEKNVEDNIDERNMYGPRIPENLTPAVETPKQLVDSEFKPSFRRKSEREIDSSSSSNSWVDVKDVKHKSKHKKKKSKKHKSKHKHKSKQKKKVK